MQWWNDFVDWFYSPAGQTVLLGAVIPFVAILVSGIIATAIARGSIKRLMRSHDRELKASAVIGLLDSARQASVWHSLLPNEQLAADRSMGAADVQLRMLPIPGASVAANWAGHEIREFKRASATFTLQFDAPLAEFRDRLIDWESNPRRARKIFERDLARWSEDRSREDQLLQQEQDAWAAQQNPAPRLDDSAATPVVTAPAPVPIPPSGPTLVPDPVPVADGEPSPAFAPVRPTQPFRRPEPVRPEAVRPEAVRSESAHPEPVRPDRSYSSAARLDDNVDAGGGTSVNPRLLASSDDDQTQVTSVMPPIGTRPLRPSLPQQIHDADEEPGAVERPTDEPYAPPIPAAFGRPRGSED
ncbi:hypothetical protein [Naasia lichenicola]|uniref:Uncharacterized protein n=1 Tax=Naasia lichenicola TaxID=2565933 RepID=A0A4S4FHM4_9MICO|nr:hypothetical protein [Naasia lichenicola]THG28635.1 hypothetical protein E6C64_17720 [Naasia lichenicola]